VSAAPAIPLQTYDVGPGKPTVPFEGSDTFGVPRWREIPMRLGARFSLVPVSDAAAWALAPGDVLLVEYTNGLHPVHVVQTRTGIAGELGAQYEVPIVDTRRHDGTWMSYDPGALLDVEVDP
jgi:hypothetical protein